jgi:cbb3-type cytochrome c oxidase subunit III
VRRATACVLLLLVMALVAGAAGGCGSDSSKRDDAAAAARARAQAAHQARLMAAGRGVFRKNCASCHTIEGRVAHPTFIESPIPNLDEVKPRAEYVRQRVESGGFDMASFGQELSPAELSAVVAYVTGVAGSRVADPDADAEQLALGEQVFRGNCERCHSIDGRRATGRPTYPGTDFNRVRPSMRMVMRQALAGIPEEMPSFRGRLTREQLQAVAAYVTTTAGE